METMKINNTRAGFTLIEILIAVAIVGLLITVGGPLVFKYLEKGKKSTAKMTVKALQQAVDSYSMEVGGYPESLRDLIKRPMDEEQARTWDGPYYDKKEISKDPWGNAYQYEKTPEAEHPYELFSYGPKGRSATAERINVWDL
jgi:general secretion pathway protein G